MPFERLLVRAGRRILEPDRVIARSRRERLAVRRERHCVDLTAMPLERLPVRAPVVYNASGHFDKRQPFLPIPLSNIAQSWAEHERGPICLQGGPLYDRSVAEYKLLCVFQQLDKARVDVRLRLIGFSKLTLIQHKSTYLSGMQNLSYREQPTRKLPYKRQTL